MRMTQVRAGQIAPLCSARRLHHPPSSGRPFRGRSGLPRGARTSPLRIGGLERMNGDGSQRRRRPMRRSQSLGGAAVKVASKRIAVATAGVACGVVAATAFASPPSGFTPTNLVPEAEIATSFHVNSDRVKLQTKGPVDVRVQRVDIAPG